MPWGLKLRGLRSEAQVLRQLPVGIPFGQLIPPASCVGPQDLVEPHRKQGEMHGKTDGNIGDGESPGAQILPVRQRPLNGLAAVQVPGNVVGHYLGVFALIGL